MEVKEGYKQTEVGVIPEDWKVAQLDELCHSICDGTHFTPEYVSQGIPFYSVENITTDDFVNTKFITPEEHAKLTKRCNPKKGDILMSRITAGILGDTKLIDWDVEASIYVSLALLRPNESVSSKYLYRYTQFSAFRRDVELQGLSNATPKKINMQDIGKIPIPLPSTKAEQEAIAKALSDADALIQSLEQLIAKKRQIKQGAMQELLTGKKRLPGFTGEWKVKHLGDIAEIIMGQSPSSSNYNTVGKGIPLIQGNADIKDRKSIRRIFTTQITKRGKVGDILLSVRAPVGKISKAIFDICLGRGICAIRFDNDFLYYLLIHSEPTWVDRSKGSTFDSVTSEDIKTFKIKIPALQTEQTAIATILSDMDREITALETKLSKARQIKQGMMQELLTGKIRLIQPEAMP